MRQFILTAILIAGGFGPGSSSSGASPGGSSGNLQTNNGAGAFGAYAGATCAYAVKQLDASGAPTCTSAPSIPTDVSGASYWTKVAEAGLSNEVALGSLASGLILNTTTTGVPTIYGGTSCAYAVKTLDASGGSTCTAAPTIPTDLSGEPFITKVASANLSNEFALGSLATGLLKNTTTTGVPTIAASGTDYAPGTSANGTGLVISTTTTGALTTYGGTSCTNQFPRSLNASGAATCNSIAGTDLPNPSATTLGGIESLASVASKWINTISTSGVPSATQPATTDISGDPVKTFVTGDVNITSATASLITGLTLTVAASTSYGFSCNIVETNTTTSAMRYAVAAPTSSTTTNAIVIHFTTVLTSAVTEAITGQWATTCTNCTAAVTTSVSATTHTTILNGNVLTGVNTGTIQIFAAASTAAQANVVKKGSYCEWWTP